ncbi:MAG: hypothetical protein CVU61_14230 [Deltaproteobacteria bacterium HGW-Deltaproteobacteria-19]|jgi:TolB-like protein|nr:MAG: hypothetical protein CVU61_14230 [Deltaproteobacteria bacterium HGW-Deltaproteobacteria-19]
MFVWAAWAVLLIALLAGCRNTFVNAIIAGDGPAVTSFLNQGSDVNEKGADGFTPLHWAAYYGKADIITLLVSRGANVNASSPYGTPLTLASQYGFTAAVKALLDAGADPSIKDASGQTAAGYAQQGGFTEIVALLGGAPSQHARAMARPEPQPATPPPASVPGPTPVPVEAAPAPAESSAPVRIAVYNFQSLTIDASAVSAPITDTLSHTLRKTPSFHLVERKELEEFLSLNDLQQNEKLGDIIHVGERMGIPYIVAGSVEKKKTVYIVHCRLIDVPARKVIMDRQARSFGEAGLNREVEKLGEAIARAIRSR